MRFAIACGIRPAAITTYLPRLLLGAPAVHPRRWVTIEGLHPPLRKHGADCLQIVLSADPVINHSPMEKILNTHYDSLVTCTWRLATGRSALPYLRQPTRSHVAEDTNRGKTIRYRPILPDVVPCRYSSPASPNVVCRRRGSRSMA